MTRKTNVSALEETLQCLTDSGHIETVDAAAVQALRSMAASLDDDPSKAALWREYLNALAEVRRADDNANSGIDDALAKIAGAAPLGNQTQA
jgi:hypothetical protein